jgi:hypothetical protein
MSLRSGADARVHLESIQEEERESMKIRTQRAAHTSPRPDAAGSLTHTHAYRPASASAHGSAENSLRPFSARPYHAAHAQDERCWAIIARPVACACGCAKAGTRRRNADVDVLSLLSRICVDHRRSDTWWGGGEERRWGGPVIELDQQRDQRGGGDELDRRQGATVGLS